MNQSPFERERALIEELGRLAQERARAEAESRAGVQALQQANRVDQQEARQQLAEQYQGKHAELKQAYADERQDLVSRYEAKRSTIENDYTKERDWLTFEQEAEREALEKGAQEALWSVTTVFEAGKVRINENHGEVQKVTGEGLERLNQVQAEADALLDEWGQEIPQPKTVKRRKGEAAIDRLRNCLGAVEELFAELKGLTLPRFMQSGKLWGLYFILWFAVMAVLGVALKFLALNEIVPVNPAGFPRLWYVWAGVLSAVVGGVCTFIHFHLGNRSSTAIDEIAIPLYELLHEAKALCKKCQDESAANHQKGHADNQGRRDRETDRISGEVERKRQTLASRHAAQVENIDTKFPDMLDKLKARFDADLKQIDEDYPRKLAENEAEAKARIGALEEDHRQKADAEQHRLQEQWRGLVENWRGGLNQVNETIAGLQHDSDRFYPSWQELRGDGWQRPDDLPAQLRFGQVSLRLDQIPEGIASDERLRGLAPDQITMPASLPYPRIGSLLIESDGSGRDKAIALLQATMMRYLTAFPPGKVRFLLIDPVGRGESFASFMRLADFDPALVASRIWTEPNHIEQRLADLTDHMETVIQKYLRHEFPTIAEYNAKAGEVAEPYRVLVVADFPANFSEGAARRLLSIASSGPSCGVFTLGTLDRNRPLPHEFHLKDYERVSVVLDARDHQLTLRDKTLGQFTFEPDRPPEPETWANLLEKVGAQAREAGKVEVPFEIVVPPRADWWTQDSRAGLRVPLGRAGANKLQYLDLGKGTSQHVLVAGKTGSGKSTLLHALITSAALQYSPREVELYLVDFKKGVEFKTYATHRLPHARVVAIESEREFGLSVLQRLDVELKRRGEIFRDLGVQDLNGYRQERLLDAEYMARILLVVDEFQEFFVEDDKIAQEAALLMDRLVRQGRAFGIHVLLGSQTLGGAYSLARSTLGQMAVRIALPCSESDASLILSDDNTVARLLSRPGEAIYNEANGRVEGNDFFQVVWLPDERREVYLRELDEMTRTQRIDTPDPIVFEGNIPADLDNNPHLQRALESDEAARETKSCQAWLGDAVAIKDPTSAVFKPRSGANLLVIGQQDETALSLIASSLISVTAQLERCRLHLLDGTPVDDRNTGYLERLANALPTRLFGDGPRVLGTRDAGGVLGDIAAEVKRRQDEEDVAAEPIFLVVHGLQRFRDLRRSDDDFGYGRDDEPASPSKLFGEILREGPTLGVYVLAWCDTLNNVMRTLDRSGLREFEMRVLLQMSSADSSTLIDTPAASKLGLHRALLYLEERGDVEKFRPYALPGPEYLERLSQASAGVP